MNKSSVDYYVPWDVSAARASDEAASMASPKYDLSKHEDRQRCWFGHLVENNAGGLGLFCQTLDVDRNSFEDWVYRGKPLDQDATRQLSRHKDEFDQLASNDPFWAQLNVMGVPNAK